MERDMKVLGHPADFELSTEKLLGLTCKEPFGLLCSLQHATVNLIRPFPLYEIWVWNEEHLAYVMVWVSPDCSLFIDEIINNEIQTIIGYSKPKENITEFHRRLRTHSNYGALYKLEFLT
jgi:hypothetical protein